MGTEEIFAALKELGKFKSHLQTIRHWYWFHRIGSRMRFDPERDAFFLDVPYGRYDVGPYCARCYQAKDKEPVRMVTADNDYPVAVCDPSGPPPRNNDPGKDSTVRFKCPVCELAVSWPKRLDETNEPAQT